MPLKTEAGKPLRGRMLIRHYIYSLVFRHIGEMRRIPPSRELATRFGLARSTVQLELERLIQEGILVSRKQAGTFLAARNSRSFPGGKPPLVIGLAVAGGDLYCYSYYHWLLHSRIGDEIVACGGLVRPLTFFGVTEDAIFTEIRDNFIDGMIWATPPEEYVPLIRRVAAELPVVVADTRIEGINSVYQDYEQYGYSVGRRLLAEGRRRVTVAGSNSNDAYVAGLRRAWHEAGLEFDEALWVWDNMSVLPRLRAELESGQAPEALLLLSNRHNEVLRMLGEYDVDLERRCRVVGDVLLARFPGFRGWCHRTAFHEVGRRALSILDRLREGDGRIEHDVVELEETVVGPDRADSFPEPSAGRRPMPAALEDSAAGTRNP